MAKAITIKALRAHDLVTFLTGLSPQEIAKVKSEDAVKNIRFAMKVADELEAGNKEYASLMDKVQAAATPVRIEGLKAINALREDKEMPKEEKDKAIEAMVDKVNADIRLRMNEEGEKVGLEKAAEAEVEITFSSDERYAFLKEVFEKVAPEKFTNLRAIAEVAEALETAREA